jgi:beta-lactam-binding protein with PASTA domain/outer membrane protein assembly factor BamD (BamD/ComL family)
VAFLNSCEGARGSEGDPFSGTAATLVRRGIPAVVAMQYQITDKAAIEFCSAFYESLADGLPVDAAVTEARVAVSMDSMLEWGTPVLYMRSRDGRLFDISSVKRPSEQPLGITDQEELHEHQERTAREKERKERLDTLYAQARRSHQNQEWQAVVDVFEQIRAEDQDYPDPQGLLQSALEAQKKIRKEQDALRRYREAVKSAWTSGELDRRQAERLRDLANKLELSSSAVADIEHEIMGDTTEAILERQEEAAREEARNRRLEELYTQARRSHQDQEWQAVIDLFEQIRSEDPTYPDPEELLTSTREVLDAQESERRVAALYAEGQRYMDAGKWQRALKCFEEVQRLEASYRDTEELLSQVQQELAPPPTVEVPDLRGQVNSQARGMLFEIGLSLGAQNDVSSNTVPEGQIIEQSPQAGTEVEADSSVDVTVSSGRSVKIPELAGKSHSYARKMLVDVGLKLGHQTWVASDDTPARSILEQQPAAGTEVERGTLVHITISSGPQEASATVRSDKELTEVRQTELRPLRSHGFVDAFIRERTKLREFVNKLSPNAAAEIEREVTGETIEAIRERQKRVADEKVSHEVHSKAEGAEQEELGSSVSTPADSKPSTVKIPELAGKSHSYARKMLVDVGLKLGHQTWVASDDTPARSILEQQPAAGTEVERGTLVHITISSGPR